jgi:hypothetical protein
MSDCTREQCDMTYHSDVSLTAHAYSLRYAYDSAGQC